MDYIIEPPPFRSVDEALEFLVNHEIATNNRYVVKTSKNFSSSNALNLTVLENKKILFEFPLENNKHCDGVPYAVIGVKTNSCQYGADCKGALKLKYTTAGFKKRRRAHSKKINCPANTKMTLIMKFPEYAIDFANTSKHQKHMMVKRLRAQFCEETQRYILVFLKIYAKHDHGIEHILMNNLTRKEVSQSLIRNATVTTLRPGATLKGKNMSGLISQFIYTTEMPICPAQPCLSQSLDQMGINEMLALYCELTGGTPNSVFTAAEREFTEENLRLLLHLCIVFANAEAENSTMRVAHQSIRVSGTEHTFMPVTCFDASCPVGNEETHMHCPYCSKSEGYTDISVLKLHYHDRHVAKAIEYGGLKFLRCLGECMTKDVYKDIRIYLQGHWHCCRCTKIFNKRAGFHKHVQNHLVISGSNKVQLDKNYYITSTPHTMCHEVKPSKSSSTVGAEANLSTISSVTEEEPVYKVEPDYTFAHATEEVLQPEYDRAVLYIQGENDQIVYTTDNHETPGEVVIHMSETETDHLHQRLRELEHKCMELEHENMAYKSHIEFLNKKIEDLTVTRQTVRENNSSPDDSDKMEIADSTAEEPTTQIQAEASLKKTSAVTEDKTKLALQQSLHELHTKYRGKALPPDSVVMESGDVNEMNTELLHIKTDIEQLKMALVIGSQIAQGCKQARYIPTVANPVYLGNLGMSLPTIVPPQNTVQNTQHLANLATAKMNVSNDKDASNTNNKKSSETITASKTPSKVTIPGEVKTPKVVTFPSTVTIPGDGKSPTVVKVVKFAKQGTVSGSSEPKDNVRKVLTASGSSDIGKADDKSESATKASEQDLSTNEMDEAFDDDNNDDGDIEMVDADDGDKDMLSAEKLVTSDRGKAVTSNAGNTTVSTIPGQPNYVVPIGIAPTGKIVTYLHMTPPTPSSPLGVTQSQGQTKSPKAVTERSQGPGQTVAAKTVVLDTVVLDKQGQGKTKISKARVVDSQDQKKSPKVVVVGSQSQDKESPTKAMDKVKIIATKDNNTSSSVVLAVVNDSVNGGKKVVSLVQNSEEEATLSIPFEYKCFQKEKKIKDDGTVAEVKKECVKNQIKLKVKGNVKALQGESLQKIVDSALSRFVVIRPPPNKKLKLT